MTPSEKLEAYCELSAYCREMFARTWGVESDGWLAGAERWERKLMRSSSNGEPSTRTAERIRGKRAYLRKHTLPRRSK